MITSRYRALLTATVLGAFVVMSLGCRTPVEPEGGLDIDVFERPGISLTTGPGGNWYVVARRGQSPGSLLTVEHGGENHLFKTVPVGERSAEILPITRVDIDWFARALEGTPALEFHDDTRNIAVDDTLGRWGGDVDDPLLWIGDEPQTTMQAVVLPVDFDVGDERNMAAHITGTIVIDDDGVVERRDPVDGDSGPYFVIPDGPAAELGPRAISASENSDIQAIVDEASAIGEISGWDFDSISAPSVSNIAELREVAAEHSVELVMADDGSNFRLGFARDAGAPASGEAGRPVAVAESGLIVDGDISRPAMRRVLRGVDALYKDHPLSAAYHLYQGGDGWRVDGGSGATRLRHIDLMSASGFAPWMRSDLVADARGLGPEGWLYLIRALAYTGRWDDVIRYSNRALELFGEWPTPAGALGMAQTRRWVAQAHLARENRAAAADALERVRIDFRRGDDPFRAAMAERQRMLVAGETGFENVVDELVQAGAEYEASRTLLLASAAQLEAGEVEAGRRLLEAWSDRFSEHTSQRMLTLYRALRSQVDWLVGETDDLEEVAARARQALESRAWDGAVVLSLLRLSYPGMLEPVTFEHHGHVLVEGSRRSDSRLFEQQLDDALGVVCTDVVFASGSRSATGALSEHCRWRVDRLVSTPSGLSSLLEGGYRFLQYGRLSSGQRLSEFLFEHVDAEAWSTVEPAFNHLFRAARRIEMYPTGQPGEDERAQAITDDIQQALDQLEEGLSPSESAGHLRRMGDYFDARGFERLALAMYEASVTAADDAGSDADEYDSMWALALGRYRAEQWSELAAMDEVASPLHAVRIRLYRGHAHRMLGDDDAGRSLIAGGIEESSDFGALQGLQVQVLAARLAIERGELDEARDHLEGVDERRENLSEAVAERQDTAIVAAGIDHQWARYHNARGEFEAAKNRVDDALDGLSGLPIEEAPNTRRRALEMAADITDDRQRYIEILDELRSQYRQLPEDTSDAQLRGFIRTLARLSIELDRPKAAVDAVDSIFDDGLAMASTRREHHCLTGMVRRFGGDDDSAQFHHERCISGDNNTRMAARSAWLESLRDVDADVSYRVELTRHLRGQLSEHERGEDHRLEWMIGFSQSDRAVDDDREQALRAALEDDVDDAEERRDQIAELAQYLIDSGQYEEVDRLLQTRPGIFHDGDDSAEMRWSLLRIESMLRQLRPFDAMEQIERLLSDELAVPVEDEAQLRYFAAVAHLQLGQYFPAIQQSERAVESTDASTEFAERLDALESTAHSSRFGP